MQDEKELISKQAKKEIAEKDRAILEKDSLIAVQKSKMDRLFEYFPVLSEYDFIMRLCERVKIPPDILKLVFTGKEVSYTGKLYSPGHKQDFEAENIKVSIARDAKNNRPSLMLGRMVYADWFRMQTQKFLERIGIKVNEDKKQMRLKQ